MSGSRLQIPAWPSFTEEEGEAVRAVLLSNRINYWSGEHGRAFEREFASAMNCDYAVALANGTLALELALRAVGAGPGDEVIVPSRSFIASASTVSNVGAVPVFADVDRDSGNVSPETVAPLITERTRGVICVHLAGWPCDVGGVRSVAREHGLWLIEDCAQAHGARIDGRSVGSFGDVAAWSFCQDKIMTTGGEGGMLTTNDRDIWRRAWEYKDHGKSWDAVYNRQHGPGFRWLHESIGSNWRLTEMQAALGRIQLGRLAEWHARRARNASCWRAALSEYPFIRVPMPESGREHGWYRFYAYVIPEQLPGSWTRDGLLERLGEEGVPCMAGSCPEIYREKAFTDLGLGPRERHPVARELGETSMMFLVHPTLQDEHMEALTARAARVLRGV